MISMDKKEHFNKLLDTIEAILSELNQYRDEPDTIVGMLGVALKPFEKPNVPITAYDTLLDYIDILYEHSKSPEILI